MDGPVSPREGQRIIQGLSFRIREESLPNLSEVNAAVHLLCFWKVRKAVAVLDTDTHTHFTDSGSLEKQM